MTLEFKQLNGKWQTRKVSIKEAIYYAIFGNRNLVRKVEN